LADAPARRLAAAGRRRRPLGPAPTPHEPAVPGGRAGRRAAARARGLPGALARERLVRWRSPEELVRIGFERARGVMLNEAHDDLLRCVRRRRVGRDVLPVAHAAGVRHLAMEALYRPFAAEANASRTLPDVAEGYLAQEDLRALMASALELEWTLI